MNNLIHYDAYFIIDHILGTENYMDKYSSSIRRVTESYGPVPQYDKETVVKINEVISINVKAAELHFWTQKYKFI